MTLCRKCGKEIPDGEELCQDCQNTDENLNDAYLDELMQIMEQEQSQSGHKEPVAEETVFGELPDLEEELGLMEEMIPEEAPMVEEEPVIEEEPEVEENSVIEEALALAEELTLAEELEPEAEEEPMVEGEPEAEEEPTLAEELEPEAEEEPMVEEEPEAEEAPIVEEEPEAEEEPAQVEEIAAAEAMQEEEAEAETEEEETVDDLLAMLSQDFEEYEAEQKEMESADNSNEEIGLPEMDESPIEASLFSEESEEGGIFTDDADALSIDNIFNDALSAIDYSEAEQEEEELDEFVSPEDAEQKEEDVLDNLMMDTLALEEEGLVDTEDSVKGQKEKKDSIWRRVFGNIITEQTAEEEEQERQAEQASAEEKAAAKEEKKKQLAEEKARKAEEAQAEKERKSAEKAEKAAVKAAAKEEKKRLKAEAEAAEVVGKINPLGASIVMVCFALICVGAIVGSQVLSHSSSVKGAESSFEQRDYQGAYRSLAGIEVSEDSDMFETKDKIRICMQLQRQLDAYGNYYELKMYLEALDSLMKGIRSYDENQDKAERYNIVSQYNELEVKLAEQLYQEFGVSESQARSINSIEDQVSYTSRLESIIAQWEMRNKEDEK